MFQERTFFKIPYAKIQQFFVKDNQATNLRKSYSNKDTTFMPVGQVQIREFSSLSIAGDLSIFLPEQMLL